MSYFLKKTNNKKGTYLQIYESYYDPTRKCGAHRSYKPLGYVHELQATGIEDPIAVFTKEVQKLNQKCKQKKQAEKEQQISDVSTEKHLGYFPLKNINDSLGCKRFIDLMQTATNFRFYSIRSDRRLLIYARTCPVHAPNPKPMRKSFPNLFEIL